MSAQIWLLSSNAVELWWRTAMTGRNQLLFTPIRLRVGLSIRDTATDSKPLKVSDFLAFRLEVRLPK